MNDRTSRSAIVIGVLLSIGGVVMALAAMHALAARNYGNALIFAGGSLSLCLLPLSGLRHAQLRQTLSQSAIDGLANPMSVGMRLMTLLCWVLMISGLLVLLVRA